LAHSWLESGSSETPEGAYLRKLGKKTRRTVNQELRSPSRRIGKSPLPCVTDKLKLAGLLNCSVCKHESCASAVKRALLSDRLEAPTSPASVKAKLVDPRPAPCFTENLACSSWKLTVRASLAEK